MPRALSAWLHPAGRPSGVWHVRSRGWQWTAALLLGIGLLVLPLQRVTAGEKSMSGGLPAVEKRVDQLEATTVSQAGQLAALETQSRNQSSQIAALLGTVTAQATQIETLLSQIATQRAQITVLEATVSNQGGQISNVQNTVGTQGTRISAVADKLFHVSRVGNDLVISGANLHLRNGLGATATTNTVGNLIIGYNEPPVEPYSRAGSHNVVVGPRHSWSSYGGFVAGATNSIFGPHASVCGGVQNAAIGDAASVSGGGFNLAFGPYSTVGGGHRVEEHDDFGWEAD